MLLLLLLLQTELSEVVGQVLDLQDVVDAHLARRLIAQECGNSCGR